MYRYNFCLILSIHLSLVSVFLSDVRSAPTETGSDVYRATENEPEFTAESKLSESTRALGLPLMRNTTSGSGANDPPSLLPSLPQVFAGGKDKPAAGLPGVPDLGTATAGAKIYLGAFQVLELPAPNPSKLLAVLGNLGHLGNIEGLPNLPGLPNLLPSS